ncbi:MAG: hypothetical protein GX575_33870 [Candidatus Anammoximicrobium sp.]|nr:hypothetical protein [Candidatus Anammoximicrobium sp.]
MLLRWTTVAVFALLPALLLAAEPDADRDGLDDAQEDILGTDPQSPERLQAILDDEPPAATARAREGYDASKDFTRVEFCHVGGDRCLWRVTFAQSPRLADTVLHLYVDADHDAATGRKSPGSGIAGTDYMLSVVADRGSSSAYSADGQQTPGPVVRHLVSGNAVLLSADVQLSRDGDGVRYGLYVLCHTTTTGDKPSPRMSDSGGKATVAKIPLSDRPKLVRPVDYLENHGVSATFGEDLLHATLAAPGVIVVPHDRLQTEGFEVDLQTTHRWPHLKLTAPKGAVWTAAPQAGKYHVGFLMYDDSNAERLGFYVQDEFRGVAVARENNNRTWLYWLSAPQEFRGGERVELRTLGGQGRFGIANLVFLPQLPEVRQVRAAVENVTVVAPVGRPGVVTISWTTTWPSPTRLEYGLNAEYGQTAGDAPLCLVHRVVLEGLDPAKTYHGRALGVGPDGTAVGSDDFTFRAVPPVVPALREDTFTIPLAVRNPHAFAADQWPITTGVPFAQGTLSSADQVRLLYGAEEVPAQVQLTARWPDGSVKWLLVTFLASAPAAGQAEYRLECGPKVRRAETAAGLTVRQSAEGVQITTGTLNLQIDRQGKLAAISAGEQRGFADNALARTVAEDPQGRTFLPGDGTLQVEQSGPIRTVVKTVSPLRDAKGAHLARIEQRIEAYRGLPWIRLHHTLVVDGPERFTALKRLSYRVPITDSVWTASLVDGPSIELGDTVPSVYQMFDDTVAADPAGIQARKGRVIGSLVGSGPRGGAVAVRDFWQNYPKAFRLAEDAVEIDLCPAFSEGTYDKFPFEKEGHHLYFYLREGRYRLKRGMSKTHELLLWLAPSAEHAAVCALFQRPLLATAPADVYCRSRAFYDVAPRNPERFTVYEAAIERNLKAYEQTRQRQRDYGMLNYGDWYGERGTNWGNVEYDTQHALLLEYVRSGNPDAFFLAHATELHNRDVDTVHAAADPRQIGGVNIHVIGHVGDYYDQAVPGFLGFAHGGFSVSHAWAEGHFGHYFLTGDRRSYETGCAVADFFAGRDLGRPYDFFDCRVPGWHLIMMASAYHATGDPYYLNAARVVVERVLEAQDKSPRPLPDYQAAGRKPFQQGGWSRMMVPGHCECEPRHRGNAGFMVAVLLSGLKYYHDVTGDERVKQSIIAGAHYLLDETYSDEVQGFRYTSCPKTGYRPGASPLMVEGIARAYLWTRDERFRRVLAEALPRSAGGSGYGKGFSMYYRVGPRVLADLEAAGLGLQAATK